MRHSIAASTLSKECQDIPGTLSSDRLSFALPPVISQTRRGRANEWTVSVSMHRMPTRGKSARISIQDSTIPPPIPITPNMQKNQLTDEPLMATITAKLRTIDDKGQAIGTHQIFEPTIVIEGKNLGRANETNVFCQALRDAYSLYIKHLRRATPAAGATITVTTREEALSIPLLSPMLARVFELETSPDSFTSTVYVQRKYDGLRAIASIDKSGAPLIYGRRGLTYVGFPRIKAEVARICQGWRDGIIGAGASTSAGASSSSASFSARSRLNKWLYLDGELYKHGMPLQIISGIVRRADESPESIAAQNELNYVVYDVFLAAPEAPGAPLATESDETPFSSRLEIMNTVSRESARLGIVMVQMAETFPCPRLKKDTTIKCIHDLYERFLREGYEGAIIRLDTRYEHSPNERHSRNLLKMKPLLDAEFVIVDYTVAEKGRARGALLFICETPGRAAIGNEPGATSAPSTLSVLPRVRFTVTPTGTIESRKKMAREFARKVPGGTVFTQNWRGRSLIVKYEELSTQGVPQRARTDGVIRDLP